MMRWNPFFYWELGAGSREWGLIEKYFQVGNEVWVWGFVFKYGMGIIGYLFIYNMSLLPAPRSQFPLWFIISVY
jgi:hypothetical protein